MTSICAIDVFAGMGCASLGFKKAGFKILTSIEIDDLRCDNYKQIVGTRPMEEDIACVDGEDLLTAAGLKKGEEFCVIGCPPCQSFSKLSTTRQINTLKDPRSHLVVKFASLVEEMMPTVVVFENVPNMIRGEGSVFFEHYFNELSKAYETVYGIVNAADYGVPQNRRRLLAISVLKERKDAVKKLSLPPRIPQLSKCERVKYPWKTVRDAISNLKPLEAGERDRKDPLHYAKTYSDDVFERIKHIQPDGGSRMSLPRKYWLRCHKELDNGGAGSAYGRMWWDRPAPTMTGRCMTPSCGRFLHPVQNRGITLREAARFQTIPDKVRKLNGSADELGRMLGDAVPVNLVERIAVKASELLAD